jgi:D-sedoheptulose 7-phosphate isomerase
MNTIKKIFEDSIQVKSEIIDLGLLSVLEDMGIEIIKSIQNGNKIMLCGNGGSAADAQHLAAEMLIRLRPNKNRQGIPAIALAQDTSTITACGNDFGYVNLYERMVLSLGKKGDCLIGISTSGNSENIILAMQAAQKMGIKVFGFLGNKGGKIASICDKSFIVPGNNTGRIQESHITAGHALMEFIEDHLLESGYLHIEA